MRRLFLAVCLVAASTEGVSGQATTADGVVALSRGDYQRAADILRPLAERWRGADPAAAFFLAGLYETGRGVPVDPLRACALYMRASAEIDGPFFAEANRLFARLMMTGIEFNDECQTLANVGFDNGFEPVTFDIGPGYFVEWTLAAATVVNAGQPKRVPMGLGIPGARFLPLQYTRLATGPSRTIVRHFVEVFQWIPAAPAGRWQLQWHVFEIVRGDVVRIDTATLTIMDGDSPPSRDAFDVRDYAALRVDKDGFAEAAVLKGEHPGAQRIKFD